jgi:hypothetical protein
VSRKRSIVAVAVTVVAMLAWLAGGRDYVARRQALSHLRPRYEQVPPFPGSVKVGERVEEQMSDSGPTGEFAVTITYRLPASAKADDFIGHIRAHLPPSWSEATDETCRRTLASVPAPPVATLPDGTPGVQSTVDVRSLVLLAKATQLTAFLPGETGTPDGRVEGVSFALSREGSLRMLRVHEATYGCAERDDSPGSEPFDAA